MSHYHQLITTFKAKLSKSNILYRLAKGAFWSLLGNVISRLFTVISSIAIARMLGKEGFGEIGMVQSTLGVFGVFAGFGLGTTATKYIAEFRIKEQERAGRILSLTILAAFITSGIMLLVCVLSAEYLSTTTLNRVSLTPLLFAGAILLFYSTMGGVFTAALAGFESFKAMAKINIWMGVFTLPIAILFVWLYGTNGAIASQTIITAIGLILSARALAKECDSFDIRLSFSRIIWREKKLLWDFSLPATISSVVAVPVTWLTNAMLTKQPNGYGELGLFNAANQWRNVVIFVPALLAQAMMPVFSETHGHDDKKKFLYAVTLSLRLTLVTACPFVLLIILFAEPIAHLYGHEFINCGHIIVVLILSCFLAIINYTIGTAVASAGHMWIGSAFNLFWAVALVISSIFFVSRYGGFGLGLSHLTAYILHTTLVMFYVEIKLAPGAILKNKNILLFLLAIILPATYFSLRMQGMIILRVIFILIAFIPLLKMIIYDLDKIRH